MRAAKSSNVYFTYSWTKLKALHLFASRFESGKGVTWFSILFGAVCDSKQSCTKMLANSNWKRNLKGNRTYSDNNGKCHQQWRIVKPWVLGDNEKHRWWRRETYCNSKVKIQTIECQQDSRVSISAAKYKSSCGSTGPGHMIHRKRL